MRFLVFCLEKTEVFHGFWGVSSTVTTKMYFVREGKPGILAGFPLDHELVVAPDSEYFGQEIKNNHMMQSALQFMYSRYIRELGAHSHMGSGDTFETPFGNFQAIGAFIDPEE